MNDEDIRYLQKEQTPVKAGDTVSIIPSVAGGVATPLTLPCGPAEADGDCRSSPTTRSSATRRHLIMPEVGVDGQRKLKAAKVLCIGAGGLGSPAAMYLAAAGVGTHRHRRLRRRRLQQPAAADPARHAGRRPVEAGVGEGPAERAQPERRRSRPTRRRCRRRTRCELFEPYDVILDGTDNFPTRYLVNDACVLLGKPNAYGSIFRFEGQASVFATKDGPCYRCLYPEPPPPGLVPSCAEGGVLGVLPGIIGMIQATESDQADHWASASR